MTANAFVRLVARMKTEEEYGNTAPPSEDWISTLSDLIASARKVKTPSGALSNRELATVLAALRLYQQADPVLGGVVIGSDQFSAIENIATDCGTHEPLTPTEIDTLCERLNQ